MSGDENFLARWSRRKQALKEPESLPGEGSRTTGASEDGASPASGEGFARAEADPSEPLPRVEELTAESDISAFLRKGVPEALRKAALRRIWSLDPAIRDYVGPAENAWDFNDPDSIPGFGSGQHVTPEMIASVFGPRQAPAHAPLETSVERSEGEAPAPQAAPIAPGETASSPAAAAPPNSQALSKPPSEPVGISGSPEGRSSDAANVAPGASSDTVNKSQQDEDLAKRAGRRHGRAVPQG
jgi:hypothetical protein